jgi:hypothetical protein
LSKDYAEGDDELNFKSLVLILLLGIILAITNRSQDEYISWIDKGMRTNTSNVFEEVAVSFGVMLSNYTTTREDYIIFSVFTTEVPGDTIKTIGILKLFFVIG